MLLFHPLCYSLEFSVVAVSFILSFDFLFQTYEGNNLILINPRPSVLVINYLVVETWDFIRSEFQCTDGRDTFNGIGFYYG